MAAAVKTAPPLRFTGVVAEFANPKTLTDAAKQVREAGFKKWDCYTPFPIHGLDKAMGLKPSPLGYIVFVGGLTGLCLALLMMWWMNSYDYPVSISNKPLFSVWPVIPVMFECTVLFSVFTNIGTMLALNNLPKPYNPLFNVAEFARVTDDKFFIYIESGDDKYDDHKTESFLKSIGAVQVEAVPEYE
ncbi:MAG: DUF3341 domain-containing protein [Bacteroidetes Order II. Incertae sedis bacterium]|nr:DUF3341 domain-containing protein [Bacteroidetes Order II. bacterium]